MSRRRPMTWDERHPIKRRFPLLFEELCARCMLFVVREWMWRVPFRGTMKRHGCTLPPPFMTESPRWVYWVCAKCCPDMPAVLAWRDAHDKYTACR